MGEAMKLDLPYLVADADRHGNVRHYYRRKGSPKIRLQGEPGSPAFMDLYRQAAGGRLPTKAVPHPAAKDTLRWLCQEYYQSPDFKKLDQSTQSVRRRLLEDTCRSTTPKGRERGSALFARMEERHVLEIRDEHADHPASANNRVKAIRALYKWAKKKHYVQINPAIGVERFKGGKGWHTWTDEEIRQFEERYPIGTKPRLAFAIFRYTGVRRSDAVKMGPGMERSGVLRFTVKKGSQNREGGPKWLEIQILPELRAVLDATPSGHMTYLVTEYGKPFTVAGLGNKFREWCVDAGLPQCSAHGIRKYSATLAAEEGATTHELMALFGWDSVQQAELYTRQAQQKRIAKRAVHFLADKNKKVS